MSKRPAVDLMALTSEAAAPMQEAAQRVAPAHRPASAPVTQKNVTPPVPLGENGAKTATANLEALAFKVAPEFRKRFRQRAVEADLKLNELLFAALDSWEREQGLKR